jgi:DNA polymerase I-like protein with 3'-5' exonuclease and polymerase domains
MTISENVVPSFSAALRGLFKETQPCFDIQAAEAVGENKWPDIPKLNPATLTPALNPIMVVDGAGLDKLGAYLAKVNEYTFDYETNCVDRFFHRRARLLGIGDRNEQYIVDLLAFAGSKERLIASQGLYRGKYSLSLYPKMPEADVAVLEPVVSVIRPSLESNSHLKVGHYLEFEYIVSKWCLGIRPWNFFCTFRAERSITNGAIPVHQKDFFGLDDLVRRYCKFQIDKSSQTSFDLESPLTDEQITYLALDIRLPTALKGAQEKKIKANGLVWSVQIDMNAIPAFGDMHLNGMLADPDQWKKIIADNKAALKLAISEMDRHFIPIVGHKVKWDQAEIDRLKTVYESYKEKSPEEIFVDDERRLLKRKDSRYAELGEKRTALEALRKIARDKAHEEYKAERAKGNAEVKKQYAKMEGEASINYGASGQVLAALHNSGTGLNTKNCPNTDGKKTLIKHMDIPIVKALVTYKKIAKQLETYGYRWITSREEIDTETGKRGFVDPDTGRIHARHQQHGTDTGRASCTDPNMYNLPRDRRYRESFISRVGHDLVCKDCAGQELRILVEFSKEQAWVEAFLKEQDLHSISAEMINFELWAKSAIHEETLMTIEGKQKTIPPCYYFHKNKEKCDCPKHKEVRNDYKALTLGIIYDKSAYSLAIEMGKHKDIVEVMLNKWKDTFKVTQAKMDELRSLGYDKREARTISGRRRIIHSVSYEQAKKAALEKYGDKCDQNKITQTMQSLIAAVKREAGNMPIQGSAADQMMTAMGCGFDPDGRPYLWHVLEPKYNALMENYVYDEFVVESPEEHSKEVEKAVEDAIIRSGAEFVKSVPFASDGEISKRWQK